ncbi:MAG: ABC transporter substrate-binding protein [Thermoprotei archaeon]
MRTLKTKTAVSTTKIILVVAIILIIAISVGVLLSRKPPSTIPSTPTSTTYTSPTPTPSITTSNFQLEPPNKSVLVDDVGIPFPGDLAPDALDPATGFSGPDTAVFNNVFQELVEPNGSSIYQVVPVLASNYTIENNYQTYVFSIRQNVKFSNGDPLNAYDVWFSFVRELYLGQAVGSSNYAELTFNPENVSATDMTTPWGLLHALQYATGLPATTNYKLASQILNQMLSHFNPDNATQLAVMEYPRQAYVVLGPYTFEVNLLHPYRFFLLDIALWWGAIVDPTFVDEHGGVYNNTVNAYFDANGGPGTGPYEIRSVGVSFSSIVLQPNPLYWGINATNVPAVAQPPHIPIIVVNYGLPQNTRIEDFATNKAQISLADSPSLFNEFYDAYQYKQYYSFNQIFKILGPNPGFYYISMNTQKYPTNNVNFRLAIEHAINYTQILYDSLSFNGTLLGQLILGPVTPSFTPFYNPGNLPLYSFNLNLAAYYLNLAGKQEDFSVTMPNGTVLGNTSAPPLGPLTIYYLAPESQVTRIQLEVIQNDLSQLGLSVGFQGFTLSMLNQWTTPQATPNFVDLEWGPDWADPILQLIAPAVTTTSYLQAWMNLSSVNQIMATLPFLTNQTQQIQLVKQIYNITYNYAPYIWLPNAYVYVFLQPYVKGFVYNALSGYRYNTIYYSNQ